MDSCVGEGWTEDESPFSVICQRPFNGTCHVWKSENTHSSLPPTHWFTCWLMNLITFVSARCCVQEGLFGSAEPCVGGTVSLCKTAVQCLALCVSLAGAESPVQAYLTADWQQTRGLSPCPPHVFNHVHVDINSVCLLGLYRAQNMSAIF